MRRLNLTLLGLIAVVLVAAMIVAPTYGRRGIRGANSTILVTKTFDCYYVQCEAGCEEGKCLRVAKDAATRLSMCALTFDQGNTDYVVELKVGSNWDLLLHKDDLKTYCKNTDELGRVVYELRIRTSNDGRTGSALTGITLCLAADITLAIHHPPGDLLLIGSEYEQEHFDPGVFDVSLPDPTDPGIGANVILCPAPPCP